MLAPSFAPREWLATLVRCSLCLFSWAPFSATRRKHPRSHPSSRLRLFSVIFDEDKAYLSTCVLFQHYNLGTRLTIHPDPKLKRKTLDIMGKSESLSSGLFPQKAQDSTEAAEASSADHPQQGTDLFHNGVATDNAAQLSAPDRPEQQQDSP